MASVEYIKDNQLFSVDSINGTFTFDFNQKYTSLMGKYDTKDFDLYILNNTLFTLESDIFKIFLDKNTIFDGYLFHVSLLQSEAEFDEEYDKFSAYLYIAYKKLLELNFLCAYPLNSQDEFINKYFTNTSNLFVLVMTHYETSPIDITPYYLDLLALGFSKDKTIATVDGYFSKNIILENNEINLRKSKYISKPDDFISNILEKNFFHANKPELRFYYMYQIIEKLMREEEAVFWEEIKQMIIKNEDRGLIKKSILSSKAEDTLINRVFTKYNVASPKTEPEFISAISQAEIFKDDTNIKTIADNFYAFRNKFVHDYERLMESKTLIADLCFYAEKIVFDILKNRYKE